MFMCLILFAIDAHPDWPLVIASNRDETYARATASLAFWPDAPDVLGGRDLEAGGSWLGMHRDGRWAAVTNVRQGADQHRFPRSRGDLVRGFLLGSQPPSEFLAALEPEAQQYGGFNLLLGAPHCAFYYSNRHGCEAPRQLGPGIYGLANAGLDTAWPKVTGGVAGLRRILQSGVDETSLLALLRDDRQPPDDLLPDTGVGLELERRLGRRFIATEHYGTRAATAILVDRDRQLHACEQTFGPGGTAGPSTRRQMAFALPGS